MGGAKGSEKMELRVLRYFLAVAREENITAAAKALHVTQPTLSKQLMELEGELGKKLFLRGSRKITLTQEGMFLQKRAQEMVDLADKTEAAFQADEIAGGDVFIGGGETEAMTYIAKAVKQLQMQHQNIRFHLYSGNGEDIAQRLDKGLIDFGLFVGSTDLKKYDYLCLPTYDTWGLLLRREDPLADKPWVTPGDLAGIPLICSRQALLQNELAGWLGRSPEVLEIVATYTLLYNATHLVREGVGAALCIRGLVDTTDESALCFRPLQPAITANLVIAWKKHQVFSKAAKLFLQRLQEALV